MLALAVGLRIHAIRIGSGRVAYRFRVFRTRIEVCPLFIAGGACFISHPGEPARWRVAVCMGAPLVMHAALVPVSILWSWPIVVVLLNAFDLCVNSYPSMEDDGIPSDGAQLLLLWINEDDRDSWRFSAVYWPIQFALAEGRHEDAFRAAERALAHYPQFDALREAYVTAAIRTRRFRTAHEVAADREWVLDDDDEPTRETAVLGAVSPSNRTRVRLLELYLAMGQFGRAEDEARRAAEAAATEEERCRFEASIALAQALAGSGGDSCDAYARMPWLPDALYAHVVHKLEAGCPSEAQIALRQAENRNRFDGEEGTRAALARLADADQTAMPSAARSLPVIHAAEFWPAGVQQEVRAHSGGGRCHCCAARSRRRRGEQPPPPNLTSRFRSKSTSRQARLIRAESGSFGGNRIQGNAMRFG